MVRTIFHITAGNDSWSPTDKELQNIVRKFRRAIKLGSTEFLPVVITRNAVQVQIIDYEDNVTITSERK